MPQMFKNEFFAIATEFLSHVEQGGHFLTFPVGENSKFNSNVGSID